MVELTCEGRVEAALDARDAALNALAAGDLATALDHTRTGLALLDGLAGVAPETAALLVARAAAEEAAGALTEARATLVRAEAALSELPAAAGEAHDLVRLWCQIQTGLGDLERSAGDLDAAAGRLAHVRDRSASLLGPDDDATLSAGIALGIVRKYAGSYAESEAAYLAALAVVEGRPGGGDRELLASLFHNLGGICHAQNRPAAGIAWAERGLALQEAALGPGHPDVARDLAALSALYAQAGRTADATAAAERALAIYERRLGPAHFEVGMTAANLAVYRADAGEFAAAITLHLRALRILGDVLGPDHPECGLTWLNLGVARARAGQADTARTALLRAVTILTAALPAGHPHLAAAVVALEAAPDAPDAAPDTDSLPGP